MVRELFIRWRLMTLSINNHPSYFWRAPAAFLRFALRLVASLGVTGIVNAFSLHVETRAIEIPLDLGPDERVVIEHDDPYSCTRTLYSYVWTGK